MSVNAYNDVIDKAVRPWLEANKGWPMDCLVKLRISSPHQEPTETTELWMPDSDACWDGTWLSDWWEGESHIEVLGILPLDDVEVPENYHYAMECDIFAGRTNDPIALLHAALSKELRDAISDAVQKRKDD